MITTWIHTRRVVVDPARQAWWEKVGMVVFHQLRSFSEIFLPRPAIPEKPLCGREDEHGRLADMIDTAIHTMIARLTMTTMLHPSGAAKAMMISVSNFIKSHIPTTSDWKQVVLAAVTRIPILPWAALHQDAANLWANKRLQLLVWEDLLLPQQEVVEVMAALITTEIDRLPLHAPVLDEGAASQEAKKILLKL
jgi:hypothetical protein